MATVVHVTALSVVITAAVAIFVVLIALFVGSRLGGRALRQRLGSLASRLGADVLPHEPRTVDESMSHLERATDRAAEAVAEVSSETIRLRRALDSLGQAVLI